MLPNAFIIHMPHTPSFDIAKFRSSDQYREYVFSFVMSVNTFIFEMKSLFAKRITSTLANFEEKKLHSSESVVNYFPLMVLSQFL